MTQLAKRIVTTIPVPRRVLRIGRHASDEAVSAAYRQGVLDTLAKMRTVLSQPRPTQPRIRGGRRG